LMVSTSMVSANSSAHTSETDETSSTQDDDVSVPASVVSAPLSLNTKNTSESHADDNTRDRPQFGSEKGQRKSSAPAALSPSMSRLEQEALEEEIRELKRNAKKKDLEMERMKDEILDRKDSIVEKDKQIGRLKRQLEESKNTIEEVKREYQAPSSDREQELKEENDRLNLTVVELKKELKKEIEKSQRKDREAVFLKEQATRAQEDASAAAHTSDSKKEEKLRKQLDAARERVEEYRLLINAIYNAEAEYEENNGCPSGVRSIVSRLKEWETFDGETDPKVLFDIIDTIRLCYKKGKREEEKLISWLGYSVALLHRTIPLHENGKNEDIYSDHRDVDKLHPYDRYYTLLFSLIYDIYSDFISCICNELDQIIIIPYIQTKMKKNVNHNLAEFSEYIGNIVQLLRKHHLSNSLITSITKQILSVVDAHLFNSLLQRPDLFTGTSGMQIKIAISQIESAVNKLDKYISNIIRDEIVHTREAANFLATADKSIISDPQIAHQMIPHLNPVQLKFFIDRFNSTETGSAVPESVKSLVTEACKKDWDQPLEKDVRSCVVDCGVPRGRLLLGWLCLEPGFLSDLARMTSPGIAEKKKKTASTPILSQPNKMQRIIVAAILFIAVASAGLSFDGKYHQTSCTCNNFCDAPNGFTVDYAVDASWNQVNMTRLGRGWVGGAELVHLSRAANALFTGSPTACAGALSGVILGKKKITLDCIVDPGITNCKVEWTCVSGKCE
ncbi:hypothetical protein PROFUN_16033, partial [Planoprotostelium fungivorum]